jgi:membrane-bound ClpP family serine protease
MAAYTDILLLGITLLLIYITSHKEHPFVAGLLYILTGAMSFIVMNGSNAYGFIMILLGFIRLFTAPLGGPSAA